MTLRVPNPSATPSIIRRFTDQKWTKRSFELWVACPYVWVASHRTVFKQFFFNSCCHCQSLCPCVTLMISRSVSLHTSQSWRSSRTRRRAEEWLSSHPDILFISDSLLWRSRYLCSFVSLCVSTDLCQARRRWYRNLFLLHDSIHDESVYYHALSAPRGSSSTNEKNRLISRRLFVLEINRSKSSKSCDLDI